MSDEQKTPEQIANEAAEAAKKAADARAAAIAEHIEAQPETAFHKLLAEFHNLLPTNFINKYEKLVGKSPTQVKQEAEAKHPEA